MESAGSPVFTEVDDAASYGKQLRAHCGKEINMSD
jgi:hypothetical protein